MVTDPSPGPKHRTTLSPRERAVVIDADGHPLPLGEGRGEREVPG